MCYLIVLIILFIFNDDIILDFSFNHDFVRVSYTSKYEGYVFTNYDDYINNVRGAKLNRNDFKKHNYVVVKPDFMCGDSEHVPSSYSVKNNGHTNIITVKTKFIASCGYCVLKSVPYLLKVDKSIKSARVKVKEEVIRMSSHCFSNSLDKPLIYLYPTTDMNVSVKLGYPNKLTTTYPEYNDGWNVFAHTDGTLDTNNKSYYGLYWEGVNDYDIKFDDGFVVKGEDTSKFLEDKLKILGLNDRESQEFIIYWLPKLSKNKYNLIRFASLDEINKMMPLEIDPKPDSLIRVLMEYKSINKNINIKEEKLVSPVRHGFTAVEWGGTLLK